VSSKTAARLNRRYRDEPAGGDSYPALKDRAKLRASLRDERRRSRGRIWVGAPRRWVRDSPHCGRQSRRQCPTSRMSQRLTALPAAEPQENWVGAPRRWVRDSPHCGRQSRGRAW